MAESDEGSKISNNGPSESEAISPFIEIKRGGDETLYDVLRGFVAGVLSPETDVSPPPTIINRIRSSLSKAAPRLGEASRRSAGDLILWARSGSPFRALFVISVGTITLLALTGLLVFMLFFLIATLNAAIIAFLISLAAAGGFLALFFACLTAIYIGALSLAVFVISATTLSTIIAVTIATGWVGFFWVIWTAAKKSLNLTKQSLVATSSAFAAYSTARQSRQNVPSKLSED